MFLGLKIEQWFALSAVAAFISMFGSISGLILKDYFFNRSFENWKQKKKLDDFYDKYRDPILLASNRLHIRVEEILEDYPTTFLCSKIMDSQPGNFLELSKDDPHFKKYKLVSTVYRICSLFGWIELYRQELVFLNSGRERHFQELERCVEKVIAVFADAQLNFAENCQEWTDRLIFREEIRAIGEVMIDSDSENRIVIGYARFCELIESPSENSTKKWVGVVVNFLTNLERTKPDFRKRRMELLIKHLDELLLLLSDDAPTKRRLVGKQLKYSANG